MRWRRAAACWGRDAYPARAAKRVDVPVAGGVRYGLPASSFMAFQDAMSWQGHAVATLPALSHVAQTWAPGTLSHAAISAVDSLSRSCSGVNLSTSHQRWPSGQGTPNRW